jgi:hypothetical protein
VLGMGTVPQLVLIALSTIRGTSAIPTLGQTFSQIREKGTGFQRQMASAVTTALSDLIKQKLLTLVSVDVVSVPSAPDGTSVTVRWRDLTTGLEHLTPVGSPS